jgi:hypothetical protein
MYSVEGFDAAREKWNPMFRAGLNDDELAYIVIGLAYKMLIPVWYHKDQLENMIGQSISEEAFQGFLSFIDDSDIDSEVGDLVIDYWKTFWEENQEEYVQDE